MRPLQPDFYHFADKIHVAVDCIIFGFSKGELKLLLFKRKVNPLKNKWSLIGSFVDKDESVLAAANRVLHKSTGLVDVYLSELKAYSEVGRDNGGRVISIAHFALIRLDEDREHDVQDYEAKWFEVGQLPPLILDHDRMIKDALEQLKLNTRIKPVGFELLPEKFTIPQLQALYEAIFQNPLDVRNFRKKVLSLDIVEKLDEKDKAGSKKGAYLYRFKKNTNSNGKNKIQLFDF